jgi:pimeloyl-ACP methyl ester carboxylesterase
MQKKLKPTILRRNPQRLIKLLVYSRQMKNLFLFVFLSVFSVSTYPDYKSDQATSIVDVDGVSIAYTTAGEEESPSVLMIMGLMASHRVWPEEIVNGFVDAGYRVVLFDNRDTGDSDRLDRLGEPKLWWKFLVNSLGFEVNAPYTLLDMAEDGIAVLDVLEIQSAHIVGASMGGMIAQTIASEYPERTKSLVSIMSTTGAKHLPEMTNETEGNFRNFGDGNFGEINVEQMRSYGFYPESMPRQLTAIFHAGDRSEQVKNINVKTLVQHGANDPLLPPDHGRHTAELIEGSKLVIYEGMGHNLPPEVLPTVISDMLDFFGET